MCPAHIEIFFCKSRIIWKGFKASVRQLYFCIISFVKQFKGYKGIACVPFIAPAIGELFIGNYFCYFTKMYELFFRTFACGELKFETNFSFKFFKVKILFSHFFFICNSFPHFCYGSCISSLDYIRSCIHKISGYDYDHLKIKVTIEIQNIYYDSLTAFPLLMYSHCQ